jgi:MFS family permease
MSTSEVAVGGQAAAHVGRPTRVLPVAQILQLSMYWFAISAIWGTVTLFLQRRMEDLVPKDVTGTAYGAVTAAGALVAILVQPTIGSISDYTTSRWGRRKPYIALGAVFDVLFLAGLATSQTYVSVFAFVCLLQLSSNTAQGPFQGYLPDLVPAPQVSFASAVYGVMNVLGKVCGIVLAAVGQATGNFTISLIGVGLLELAIATGTIAWVDEGRQAPSREGRPWHDIARSAWGLDILRERNFVWLVASRLFLLLPIVGLLEFENFFLQRSLGLNDQDAAFWNSVASVAVGGSYILAAYPAARLSDRIGRKNVIYVSAAIAGLGLLGVVLAPTPVVATAFIIVLAIGGGSFFAVDWALMTDIIPKVTSGRFMGISNVVTAGAGPVSAAISGVIMDRVGAFDFTLGPRAALAVGIVFLVVSAFLLRNVDERRRD